MKRRAVVVGAGIAGLAAAHALTEIGYEVRVLEREAELRAEGAGLTLWPNAIAALQAIGLDDVVRESTREISSAVTLTPAGGLLAEMPLDRIGERFGPLVSAHRADLLHALQKQVDTEIEFGAGVSATAGTLHARGTPLEAELIIGADGIGSAVRAVVAPGFSPRPAGYAAWRGVAQTGHATPDRASETLGRGKRFGIVPLPGERTYWFAVLMPGDPDDKLEAEFSSWHPPILQLLETTPAPERSYMPVYDLPPLARWHRDRTMLVGDAAHATTPNLGQGAAQALEDVAALTSLLREMPPTNAFGALERSRKRRAERIVKRSRAVGRVAQAANPMAAALRDFAARHTPESLVTHQLSRVLKPSTPSRG